MTEVWAQSPEVVSLGQPGGLVTLVEGSTFCIAGRSGDIKAGAAQGLFYDDARFLSQLELKVNSQPLEPLSVAVDEPFAATFVSRCRPRPERADSTVMVFRHRYLGRGLREDIVIKNYGDEPAYSLIELSINADFANIFEVKENRAEPRGELSRSMEQNRLSVRQTLDGVVRGIIVGFSQPATWDRYATVAFEVTIETNGEWRLCLEAAPVVEGEEVEPRFRCGEPVEVAQPTERLVQWRNRVPAISTNHDPLAIAVRKGQEDLGSLRIFDAKFPYGAVIAAGAPWFMALFGRDSLLTAWMALMVDPELSLGVLDALAKYQGEKVNPLTDEEPGRILHEMRAAKADLLGLDSSQVYYGTVDATPLFVMLLGELRRWGLAPGLVERLLPHADRALDWIQNYGDRDGDGYVEYARGSESGIRNQGWKDSFDSIRFANGELAATPIALAEVQGYVYAAYQARKHFAREAGDHALAERYRTKAHQLKAAFNRDFWVEDGEYFAMALDGNKQKVDAVASNMGHCLWTGIVDDDKAVAVARHLLSPELFSGWGIRTLATNMAGYNPIGYHTGSVWPHDTAICAAGLARYGFMEETQRVVLGMLDAAVVENGRLPELFSGLDRSEISVPVSYPTSCSPQAWAAAAPLLGLRSLLRFEPSVPRGQLSLAPSLPPQISFLRVERIPLNGRRISVEVHGNEVNVEGLDDSIEVLSEPRRPAG